MANITYPNKFFLGATLINPKIYFSKLKEIIDRVNDLSDGSISTTSLILSGTLTVGGDSAFTGKIVTGAGTVSSPAVVIGANDNGMYEVSATQQGFSVGNTLVGGYNSTGLFTDNISEQTTNAGVTIDGVLLKDNTITSLRESVIDATAATLVLTSAQSGSFINLNRTGGVAVTLPAAATGLTYKFIAAITNSGGNTTITCNGADLLFGGSKLISTTANNTAAFLPNGSTNNVFTMNGTTTGGIAGSEITLVSSQGGRWTITTNLIGSGALATNFSG